MSRGAGSIERRIADLFAATADCALSVDEITRHAFALGSRAPTRAQRLSATRAAHRAIRRAAESWPFWCATTIKKRLWFHPDDVPVQVWAVTIDRRGVHWFDCEIIKITARNVMVRYRGEVARLDRSRLFQSSAFYRGVRFVSSQTGHIAAQLDELWQRRYAAGGVPPSLQMPLARAVALLGVPADYTKEGVIAAFRRKAKEVHPDAGGTAEMFRVLVEARDRLLAALGTSAPPPPKYAPKGARIVYRRVSLNRLGAGSRRLIR